MDPLAEPTVFLSVGEEHAGGRLDIFLADRIRECSRTFLQRMIREGFLRQMVELRWPNRETPIPHWVRDLAEARDLDAERLDLDKLKVAQEHGLALDLDVKYELAGLPLPRAGLPQPELPEQPGDEGDSNAE